jgi:hypothetical protein
MWEYEIQFPLKNMEQNVDYKDLYRHRVFQKWEYEIQFLLKNMEQNMDYKGL